MVGLERSVLPLVGETEFGLALEGAILAFIVAFGATKALANLAAGTLADRVGRRRLLVLGWLLALPVPLLIGVAPTWGFVVAANLFLGASQGFAWSMTVVMKIDLVGPRRRGLALGFNESAGYLGVAATALASGLLAAHVRPANRGLGRRRRDRGRRPRGHPCCSCATRPSHVAREQAAHGARDHGSRSSRPLSARLLPRAGPARLLAGRARQQPQRRARLGPRAPLPRRERRERTEVGVVAAVYPAVWGTGQLGAGWLSDHIGRKPLIAVGMLVQGVALALLVAGGGDFARRSSRPHCSGSARRSSTRRSSPRSPTPSSRATARQAVGIYRFWRDFGFVAGGVLAGLVADAAGIGSAIAAVAVLTAASGLWVAATRWHGEPRRSGSG